MAQNVYTLYAVSINGTVISQIQEQGANPGLKEILMRGDGDVDPTFAAIIEANPMFSFRTTAVASFLALCGINGLAISTSVILYYQLTQEQGLRAGSGHKSLTATKGMIIPRRATAQQGQAGSVQFDVFAVSSDGTTHPWTTATGVALPTQQGTTEAFTLGPVSINGTAEEGVQSLEVLFNIQEELMRHSGLPYPLRVHGKTRSPSVRFRTSDASAIHKYGAAGVAQGATDSVAYFRKISRLGTIAANNAGTHISFTVDDGIWKVIDVSGSDPDQEGTVECRPVSDLSNAIIAISTAASIT